MALGAGILAACGSDFNGSTEGSELPGASGVTGETGGNGGADHDGTGGANAGSEGQETGGANPNTGGGGSGGEGFGGDGSGGEGTALGGAGTGGQGTGGRIVASGGGGTGGVVEGSGGEWAAFGGGIIGTGGEGTGGVVVGSGGDGTGGGIAGASGAGTGGVVVGSGGDGTGGGIVGTGGDAGGSGLCGGVTCAENEECCGPPECGHCIIAFTGPQCADSCPTRPCGDDGVECYDPVLGFPGQLCVEVQALEGGSYFKCEYNPCGPDEPLDCSCAARVCADGTVPGPFCREADAETLSVRCEEMAAVCASPDTPIATPAGDRPIASLAVGDLVYSAHDGALMAVPLARVARTPVDHHHVVRVQTADGVVLEISEGHPTADGRTFADLRAGDQLDGSRIISRELVPYRHQYTYDILPASETGTYVAGGKLIGSTLSR